MVRQMEIDGRNAGDGVYAQAFRMRGQLAALMGVVAGNVGNDGAFALHFRHDRFQHGHALFFFQINAFSGGAAHIQACDALVYQITRQLTRALHADRAVVFVAGVKRRDDAMVFFK